jgi:hypothetical protein
VYVTPPVLVAAQPIILAAAPVLMAPPALYMAPQAAYAAPPMSAYGYASPPGWGPARAAVRGTYGYGY